MQTGIHHVVQDFLNAKRVENLATDSISWYMHMLNAFLRFIEQNHASLTIFELDASMIRQYIAAEQAQKLSERTIRSRYEALQTLFNWLEGEYSDFSSPMGHGRRRRVKPPRKSQVRQPHAEPDQVQTLLDSISYHNWIDVRDKAIITLLFTTGIRRGELLGLQIIDIDFAKCMGSVHGKGGKDRDVPLEKDTWFTVWSYTLLRPEVPYTQLWVGASRQQQPQDALGKTGIRLMLDRRCAAAGISRLTPHMFRRGCATYLLNQGADITFIQQLLGHTSPEITKKFYAMWRDETFRRLHQEYWHSS